MYILRISVTLFNNSTNSGLLRCPSRNKCLRKNSVSGTSLPSPTKIIVISLSMI